MSKQLIGDDDWMPAATSVKSESHTTQTVQESTVTIGKTENGQPMRLNVPRLLVSRALLTASSGGGKSWLLRKIVEDISESTQTIVFDLEGEFASLREVRDMILVGADGADLLADPRTAGMLCRRIMEKNVSAVLDIYELSPANRRAFTANFLTEMLSLPKSMWRPCFVVIDEAHELAPNTKDKDYVSGEPIALLCSKGRKRGYCAILATQRLAKLNSDVAAEMKNRFIGSTTFDLDLRRAADFLGWGKDRWAEIRDLSSRPGHAGEFLAVGPALTDRGIVKFRSGKVQTTHPEPGQGLAAEPPKPSKAIAAVLNELKDLPSQAAEEARNFTEAKNEIEELRRQLKQNKQPAGVVDAAAAKKATAIIAGLTRGMEQAMSVLNKAKLELEQPAAGVDVEQIKEIVNGAVLRVGKLYEQAAGKDKNRNEQLQREIARTIASLQMLVGTGVSSTTSGSVVVPTLRLSLLSTQAEPVDADTDGGGNETVGKSGLLRMLTALAQRDGLTRKQIGIRAGISSKSGTFTTYMSTARKNGWISDEGGKSYITDAGREALGAYTPLPSGIALRTYWLKKLGDSGASRMLTALVAAHPHAMSKEEIGEAANVSSGSGTFTTYMSTLRKLDLVVGSKKEGGFKASEELF